MRYRSNRVNVAGNMQICPLRLYLNAAGKTRWLFPATYSSQSSTPAASVLNLGVTFDENFNFIQHISKTYHCCLYHIRDLRRIRRFLSVSIAKTIATALVGSILDYWNSFLYNTASKDIAKLQRVQNCLPRVVTRILIFLAQCRF